MCFWKRKKKKAEQKKIERQKDLEKKKALEEKEEVKETPKKEEVKEVKAETNSRKVAEKKTAQKETVKKETVKKETKKEEKENIEENDDKQTKKSVYRVLFDKEDKLWKIKKDGAKRVIDSKKTKEEAIARVQELSESQDTKFVVYKKDGKFQKKANLKLKKD